jgi:hypothetical protein
MKLDSKTVSVEITGVRPILLHNGQSADPLNSYAKLRKPITSKKTKTDDDLAELAKIDWYSSLYHDADKRLILPSEMIESLLANAGSRLRMKRESIAAISVFEPARLVGALGANATSDDYWKTGNFSDARGVRVQKNRIIRYRPRFDQWTAKFNVELLGMNVSTLRDLIDVGGTFIGLGDFRPRFGLFELTKFTEI